MTSVLSSRGGLGNVSQVPPFFPTENTYESFSIDRLHGHTTISTVQGKAFVDLKVKLINLERLRISTV